MGVVSSHSFIAYERPSYGTDPDETVVLDSLVLSLAFDGRFVGDTTLQQTLSIYQLTEKIVLNDNGYLYNNSSVSYAPEALAVCSFKPKPKGGETGSPSSRCARARPLVPFSCAGSSGVRGAL